MIRSLPRKLTARQHEHMASHGCISSEHIAELSGDRAPNHFQVASHGKFRAFSSVDEAINFGLSISAAPVEYINTYRDRLMRGLVVTWVGGGEIVEIVPLTVGVDMAADTTKIKSTCIISPAKAQTIFNALSAAKAIVNSAGPVPLSGRFIANVLISESLQLIGADAA